MTVRDFTAAWIAGFAAFAVARGDRRVVAYLVVVGALLALLRAVHRRVRFDAALCWALSACGVLHMAGGLLPSPQPGAPILYETWLVRPVLKYDQATHLLITAVVTACCWHVVGRWVDPRRCSPAARAFLAGGLAVAFGALNEVFEFLSALHFHDAYVGGLDNAGWDLVFNLTGALCAGLWCALARAVPAAVDTPVR